ncbi:MAG: hypothetical protein HYS27_16875 [Deltaproteobacteria bacterium]|nr:hypothetical protein [Deltaproteobacteria bacterium]
MTARRGKRGSGSGGNRRPTSELGLDDALAGIAPPEDELDAGFFHRTLARWLGLPEGKGAPATPVLWSYDFWKAEIVPLGTVSPRGAPVGSGRGRARFAAQVYRGADATVERYEYWLELDDARRITRSGWETRAPDLASESGAFTPPTAPGAAALAALFRDGPADD